MIFFLKKRPKGNGTKHAQWEWRKTTGNAIIFKGPTIMINRPLNWSFGSAHFLTVPGHETKRYFRTRTEKSYKAKARHQLKPFWNKKTFVVRRPPAVLCFFFALKSHSPHPAQNYQIHLQTDFARHCHLMFSLKRSSYLIWRARRRSLTHPPQHTTTIRKGYILETKVLVFFWQLCFYCSSQRISNVLFDRRLSPWKFCFSTRPRRWCRRGPSRSKLTSGSP